MEMKIIIEIKNLVDRLYSLLDIIFKRISELKVIIKEIV